MKRLIRLAALPAAFAFVVALRLVEWRRQVRA